MYVEQTNKTNKADFIRSHQLCFDRFKLLFVAFALLLTSYSLQAQVEISYSGNPSEDITACGAYTSNTVRVDILSDAADSVTIRLQLPPGVSYRNNSLQKNGGTNTVNIVEENISDLNNPVFRITPADLNWSNTITFSYERANVSSCDAYDYQEQGSVFKDEVYVETTAGNIQEVNPYINSYNLLAPAISIAGGAPVVAQLGTTVTRDISITNGGTGSLSEFTFFIQQGSGVQTASLMLLGGFPLTGIPNMAGDTIWYHLDSSSFMQAGIGSSFDFDETIELTRTYSVSCGILDSNYGAYWGCGEICQSANTVFQSTTLSHFSPVLDVSMPNLNENYCYNGDNDLDTGTPLMQTFRITNTGDGPATQVEFSLAAYMPSFIAAKNYFDRSNWNIYDAMGTLLGTSQYDTTFVTFHRFDASCVSQVRDSEVKHSMPGIVIPAGGYIDVLVPTYTEVLTCYTDYACQYNLGDAYYAFSTDLSYSDQCKENKYYLTGHNIENKWGYNKDNITNFPTDMRGGDCSDLEIHYSLLHTIYKNTMEGYDDLLIILENTGLVFSGPAIGTFTFELDNGDPPLSFDYEYNNDTIRVKFVTGINSVSGKFSIPLCFDCSLPRGEDLRLLHEAKYDDSCSGGGYLSHCETRSFTPHCGIACPEGGATPRTFTMERISLGYKDSDNDHYADLPLMPADPSEINLKNVLNGDTIRASWEIIINPKLEGPEFNHHYIEFDLKQINEEPCGYLEARERLFDPISDANIQIIRSGAVPVTCTVSPVISPGGIARYDLSNCPIQNNDIVLVQTLYKANALYNKRGKYRYESNNWVYSSYVPVSMPLPGSHPQHLGGIEYTHTCEPYNDYIWVYNSFLDSYVVGNQIMKGCNTQLEFVARGFIAEYSSSSWFPYEHRNINIFDTLRVTISEEFSFRPGSATLDGVSIDDANVYRDGGVLVFANLSTLFDIYQTPNTLYPQDENFASFLKFEVDPACELPSGIYNLSLETISQGNGSNTPISYYGLEGGHCNTERYSTPFEYRKPIPVITGGGRVNYSSNTVCWEVLLDNESNDPLLNVSNTWFYFDDRSNSFMNYTVRQGGVAIGQNSNGFYEIGSNNVGTERIFEVCADLASNPSCTLLEMDLVMGDDCNMYPSSFNDVSCTQRVSLSAFPEQSEVQLEISSEPIIPAALCEPSSYSLLMTSAQAGFLDNPAVSVDLPLGAFIEGTMVEIEYPLNSGVFELVPFTQVGSLVTIYLESHSNIGLQGLPGVLDATNNNERQARVRITFNTNCDFTSGETLRFRALGSRPCGLPAIGNGITVNSSNLYIDGAEPPYKSVFHSSIDPSQMGCTAVVNNTLTLLEGVNNPSTTNYDTLTIVIPSTMVYVENSFTCVMTPATECMSFHSSSVNSVGETILKLLVPAGIDLTGGNQLITRYSYEVVPNFMTGCSRLGEISQQLKSVINDVACTTQSSGLCENLSVAIGSDYRLFRFLKPQISIENLLVTCTDQVFHLTGSVQIDSLALGATDELLFNIRCADVYGQPTGGIIDTFVIRGPGAIGTSFAIDKVFSSNCVGENGIYISANTDENCICAPVSSLAPVTKCPVVDISIIGSPELYCGDSIYMEVSVTPDTTGVWATDGAGTFSETMGQDGSQVKYIPADGEGEVKIWFTANADTACAMPADTVLLWVIPDTIPPVFVNCPEDMIVGTDVDNCSSFVNWSVPIAIDNCGEVSVVQTQGPGSGTELIVGTYEIEYIATDSTGLMDTCAFTITVIDTQDPLIVCPKSMSMPADAGSCTWTSEAGQLNAVLAVENCDYTLSYEITDSLGIVTTGTGHVPSVVFEQGTTEICYSLVDSLGVELIRCCFTVTVEDEEPPTLTCPSDLSIYCASPTFDADTTAWFASVTATDNCDAEVAVTHELVITAPACSGSSTSLYRFTAIDTAGNIATCEARIILEDNVGPEITTQAVNDTVDCDGTGNDAALLAWLNSNGGAVAMDACSDTMTWSHDFSGITSACGQTGSAAVTFTVTDACGNTSTTMAEFTIQDTLGPNWTIAPTNLTVECNGDPDPLFSIEAWLLAAGNGSAEDLCGTVSYTNDFTALNATCDGAGSTMVVYTATDECGNTSTATATITVVDNTPPEITSPAKDTLVECDGMDNAADLATWLANNGGAVADDICGVFTWNTPVLMTEIAGCGNTKTLRYMFNATDACGNTSINTIADFKIQDTTPPVINPEAMTLTVECDGTGNDADFDAWIASMASAGATDACGGDLTWSYDLVADEDSCGITGIQLYRFTVVDACGNSSETEGTFTIEDTQAPVITGGANYSGECDQNGANNDDEFLSWLNNNAGATANDVCGSFTWSNNYHIDNWVEGCNDSRSIDITFYATDLCGNVDSTTYNFSTGDNTAPVFTNCPRPPVIVDAPEGWCSAFVNFSLPLATDNCGVPTVEQTDTKGLSSGDLFPVGLTTLEFTATDSCGNSTVCELKIIVNDYHVPPTITCPTDTSVVNDFGMCGAEVNNLSPTIADNCPDNMNVVYSVKDASGVEIATGLEDVSGFKFPVGINEVTYTVYDQPLFLITEVLQDGTTSGVEVGNFGAASLNISCAKLIRSSGGVVEEHIIPNGTILNPGEVYTHDFSPLATGIEATYSIMFIERTLDEITINTGDLVGSDIIRVQVKDTDTPNDFRVATLCNGGSYGAWNPELPFYAANGSTTALQSEAPSSATCSFNVEVKDVEAPMCAMHDTIQEVGTGLLIESGMCIETTVSISGAGKVGDVNVKNLDISIPDAQNITLILTSPAGTKITLLSDMTQCAGSADILVDLDDSANASVTASSCGLLGNGLVYKPIEAFKAFYGEDPTGDWVLSMYLEGTDNATLNGFDLEVLAVQAYAQSDTTIVNDPNECGGTFMWTHPVFDDNCCEGTMEVTYSFENTVTGEQNEVTEIIKTLNGSIDKSGKKETRYFDVGQTTIRYSLTDKAGNKGFCEFVLTVEDQEAPVFPNDCSDLIYNLDPGECTAILNPIPEVIDNCALDTIEYFNTEGDVIDISKLPIGVNIIVMKATDIYGNMSTCEFIVTVNEYEPTHGTLACNDHINLSLGPDCMAIIEVDMILEGNDYGCYEDYCIEIRDSLGNIHINKFDINDVNQTFEVSIIDCNGNETSCWGYLTIESKTLPEIKCPADTVLYCNQDATATDANGNLLTGSLELLTCEQSSEITYTDNVLDNGVCGEPRVEIIRTWKLVDEAGHQVTCEQKITILPFDNSLVSFPKNYVANEALSCSDVANDPSLTKPSHTGYPKLNGDDIFGDSYCDIYVGYWDEVLQDVNCPSGYSILRHWSIQNECEPLVAGVNPIKHIQNIIVNDREAPKVKSIDTIYTSTDVWGCQASVDLPDVVDGDNCSDVTAEWYVSYGQIVGNKLTDLIPGTTHVTGYVQDACGNKQIVKFVIIVRDEIPPVVVGETYHTVSLTTSGVAKINAEDLDDGSHDGCGPITFYAKRLDNGASCAAIDEYLPTGDDNAQYNEQVHFCCTDAGDTIRVSFRVCDDGNGDGIVGTAGDNCNSQEVQVIVQDKLKPIVNAPQDTVVLCSAISGFDWDNEELVNNTFGKATGNGTCDVNITSTATVEMSCADDKGVVGYAYRTFSASSAGGDASDTQLIKIIGDVTTKLTCDRISLDTESVLLKNLSSTERRKYGFDDPTAPDPYTGFESYWCLSNNGSSFDKASVEIDCNGTFEIPNVIVERAGLCTEVGVRTSIDTFDFAGGACKKFLVKYEVIDNCIFDENYTDPVTGEINPYHTENGYFKLILEINAFDTAGPEISCPDLTIESNLCSGYSGDIDISATDNCTDSTFFVYQWKLDVDNDGIVDYPTTGWYSSKLVNAAAIGQESLPVGTHTLYRLISDGCGNSSNCTQQIEILPNTKEPTPYCHDGISTAVMPSSGSITISADYFDAGSTSFCGGSLKFTMIPNSETAGKTDEEIYKQSKPSWSFDCSVFGTNGVYSEQIIRMYVTDSLDNYDYCEVTLRIDDTNNVCPDNAELISISGKLELESSEGLEGSTIYLESTAPEFPYSQISDQAGQYSFTAPKHYDYTIRPTENRNHLNGVSTLDIVLIQKHILGIQVLDSPYKLIAADVNKDCKINGSDLIQIRKLILGVYEDEQFPNNNSWRFVDKDYNFVNPEAVPCNFAETIDLNDAKVDTAEEDFVAVKIGDVNTSNNPSNLQAKQNTLRSGSNLDFELDHFDLEVGQVNKVAVRSTNYSDIHGWQMALEMPRGVEIVGIEGAALSLKDRHVRIATSNPGFAMLSYDSKMIETKGEDEVLFYLHLKAVAPIHASKMIRLNNSFRESEAYQGNDYERLNIGLALRSKDQSKANYTFKLDQNKPNPFIEKTLIGFELDKTAEAVIQIYDMNGTVHKEIKGVYAAGYHTIEINRDDIAAFGVMYYTLRVDERELTRNMIILNH